MNRHPFESKEGSTSTGKTTDEHHHEHFKAFQGEGRTLKGDVVAPSDHIPAEKPHKDQVPLFDNPIDSTRSTSFNVKY